jgi:phosphoribosylpyrophosphate synthetase
MKYFQNCKTLDDVKSKYRKLAKEHHPDKGGDTKVMQEVNLQYSEAKKRFKNGNYSQSNQTYEGGGFADFMEAFRRHQRVKEVQARKYTHKEALPTDYAESYLIDVGKILGKRVLLVDDVITSGATIRHFAETLEALGFEVVLFGLGLQKRLKPLKDMNFCFVV